ncbi:MAG: hypothetical protein K6G52_04460 [Treponemataceae bacterium]|nr:hypothetical protein [Treponemataceae bacterium]
MKKICLSVLLLTSVVLSAFSQQLNNPDLQVIAIVKYKGTDTITLGTLKTTAKPFGTLTLEKKKELLEMLINDRLLSQAAEKENFFATDTQANQYFQQQLSQFARQPITEEQFSELLQKTQNMTLDQYIRSQTGVGLAEYKKNLKRQIAQNQYIGSKKQAEIQKASAVTHEEITSYYNNNRSTFVQPETVEIFHVIVPKGSNEAAAKKYADELLASVKSGKITQDAMVKNTQANMQAGNQDVKYIAQVIPVYRMNEYMAQLGMQQSEFDKLYDSSSLNVYSDVEEVSDSYRFYVALSHSDPKFLTLNDVVQKGTTATVYKYIENMLGLQKQQQAVLQIRNDLANELRANDESVVQYVKEGAELEALLKTW